MTLLAGAGCTLISGVGDLDATDASDGGPAKADGSIAPRADGSVTPTDGSSTTQDGSKPIVDASAGDADPDPPDVREGGSPDVIVNPPANFCDGVPASVEYCFDYDSKTFAPASLVVSGATLTVDAPGRDSNNALHCVGNDGQQIQCHHEAKLPENPGKVRLTFDVLIEAAGASIEFPEIEMTYQPGSCAIQPTITGGTVLINEYCPDQGAPDQVNHEITSLGNGELIGVWYSFDVTLDLTGRTVSGTFKKPGGAISFGPFALDSRFVTSKVAELHAGLIFATKHTPAAKVRIDNVTADVF